MTDTLTAVVKERALPCPPEVAFALFTDRIDEWWPVEPHSVAGARVASITVEPLEGGYVYETDEAGVRVDWALVTLYDAPHRLVMDWYPGRTPDEATRVEVTFTEAGEGCLLRLSHTGWTDDAAERRASYDTGWDLVLDALVRSFPEGAV
ncbi:MAG TPA: SRPBCC domain-containing protein, partial [Nocardioides sp.]|nr:SRPBCC domain-containing protein [Nocardioides sp.]